MTYFHRPYTYNHGCGIVAAEYLARGYKLSDSVLQRAIEIDGTYPCGCPHCAV